MKDFCVKNQATQDDLKSILRLRIYFVEKMTVFCVHHVGEIRRSDTKTIYRRLGAKGIPACQGGKALEDSEEPCSHLVVKEKVIRGNFEIKSIYRLRRQLSVGKGHDVMHRVIREMCDDEEVNEQELRHGGQRRKVSGLRERIAWRLSRMSRIVKWPVSRIGKDNKTARPRNYETTDSDLRIG